MLSRLTKSKELSIRVRPVTYRRQIMSYLYLMGQLSADGRSCRAVSWDWADSGHTGFSTPSAPSRVEKCPPHYNLPNHHTSKEARKMPRNSKQNA